MSKIKLVLAFAFVLFLCVGAEADTLHVDSPTIDGILYESDGTYSTAHDDNTADDAYTTLTLHRVGQTYWSETYYIRRCYYYFATSALPDDGYAIDSAKFYLYCYNDLSATDFDICVVQVFSITALATSHFAEPESIGNVSGGEWNTSNYSSPGYYVIPFDQDKLSWISKTDTTKLGLRSSRDISATAPSGDEWMDTYSANKGAGYIPYLKIWYHAVNPPDSIRTEGELSPSMITDTAPEFKTFYRDGSAQCDYLWWQVGTSVGDSNMWNSDWQNVTDIDSGNWTDEVEYAGSALSRATWYYLRVKSKNADGISSAWSETDSFRIVSDDTVWVVINIDTESGNTGLTSEDSLHPLIYFSTWHVAEGDTGYAWEAFQQSWRDSLEDSGGDPVVMTWDCMMTEPHCSSQTFSDVEDACTCIYDTLMGVWGATIASNGDEVGSHYHNYYWGGSPPKWRAEYGTFFAGKYEYYLMLHLWEKKFFPATHRGGWNFEDTLNVMNHWFEQRQILDYTNVAIAEFWTNNDLDSVEAWRFYHPDTSCQSIEGDNGSSLDRYIGRITHDGTLTSATLADVYDSAAAYDNAVASFFRHPRDDMKSDIEAVHTRLAAKTDSTGIPFVWKTAIEALKDYYGWTDDTDPTFNFVDIGDDTMRVRTDNVVFQDTLYGVTIDYSANPDTLCKIEMRLVDDTTWYYSTAVYPYKVIFAATDTCGNVGIDSTGEEATFAGRRRRMILQGG